VAGAPEEREYRRLFTTASFTDVAVDVTRVDGPIAVAESIGDRCGSPSDCCGDWGAAPSWDKSAYARVAATCGQLLGAFVRARKPE
jgi:hypothetical protein